MSADVPTTTPPPPAAAQENATDAAALEPAATDMSQLGGFKADTDFAACLLPLLNALSWRGELRHVAESLPHFADTLDLSGLRNVMARLRYKSRPLQVRMKHIDPRLLPCLFVPDRHAAVVVLSRSRDAIRIFDGETGQERDLPARCGWRGTAYVFSEIKDEGLQPLRKGAGWFHAVFDRFRPLYYQVLGVTFLLNLLALAVPMFVMAVYDKVVATGALETLYYLVIGVGIALGCDLVIRNVRARILGFIGGRLDNIVGNAVFERILYLPPAFTERATVGSQVSRLKDFESLRDFLTGPLALVLFELPFIFLFVAVLAVLGGTIALVPLVMIVLYFLVGLIFDPLVKEAIAKSARSGSAKQEFVVEAISNMATIRYTGSERTWLDRYRKLSAENAFNNFRSAQYSALVHSLSHVMMVGSGLATISFGVFKVLDGSMSIGGLVAAMILVWRVLAPLQSGFVSLNRIEQVRASIVQLNNLMKLRVERERSSQIGPMRQVRGRISFSRVSIRYRPDTDPALMGVTFDVKPGEVVCIVGGNGSGKSTILKLINGMYVPQGGNVRIDGTDIRQLDQVELRYNIGYAPQVTQMFYGTIAQNLRLANPTASDAELRAAAEKANVLDDILKIESGDGKWRRTGFEARIGDSAAEQLSASLKQRLNLTRAYLKDARVMMFDEPGNGLDFAADQAFLDEVRAQRGKRTVFIITHRPSHPKVADKILWMDRGYVRAFGPADEVMKQLPRTF